MKVTDYAEIGITTNFSFLRGGSQPQEYVHQAGEFRIPAIRWPVSCALTRNSGTQMSNSNPDC